jgi:cell division septal protein FtsQ
MQVAPVFQPARSKYLVFTTDIIIPTLICVCVVALAYTLLYSPIFKVQTVSCIVDYEPCDNPSLGAELDKLIGHNIFKLSPDTIKARLTSGDFTIRQAQITRRLPAMSRLACSRSTARRPAGQRRITLDCT